MKQEKEQSKKERESKNQMKLDEALRSASAGDSGGKSSKKQ